MEGKITQLNFSQKYSFRLKEQDDVLYIFCIVRKAFYVLTPEEWVRQHWVHYLVENCKLSLQRLALEYPVILQGVQQRADIVVFKKTKPWVLLECKAAQIFLNTTHSEQLQRYNEELKAPFLILTNGLDHLYWKQEEGMYHTIEQEKILTAF